MRVRSSGNIRPPLLDRARRRPLLPLKRNLSNGAKGSGGRNGGIDRRNGANRSPPQKNRYVRTNVRKSKILLLLLRPSVPSHLSPILRAMRERGGKGRRGEGGINLGNLKDGGGGEEEKERRRYLSPSALLLSFPFDIVPIWEGKYGKTTGGKSAAKEEVYVLSVYCTSTAICKAEHYRTIVTSVYLLTV